LPNFKSLANFFSFEPILHAFGTIGQVMSGILQFFGTIGQAKKIHLLYFCKVKIAFSTIIKKSNIEVWFSVFLL